MLCGYYLSSEIFGNCQFWMVNCTESLKSTNWISMLMELIFSILELAYHRTSQNHQVGIQLVHWYQERAITYVWIAKAVEDGFPCQRQLCHCLRSKVMIKTQVYENSICRPESQHCVFCWRILAVQATLHVLKLPFVGSENISDANLESFSYRTWQWSCRHWIWHYFWSCIAA